jgi:hypothetical protein
VRAPCIEDRGPRLTAPGNILPESTAAPALQAHQRELEKHMRRDSLEKQLQTRPKAADLVREGILEGESPTLWRQD